MRSQKQVRRVGKVRSLKNAAAGKWKIYRKCLEARKAWQNNAILTGHHHSSNTLVPPKPTRRRMKEPKQRSAEELAERQRLRKQRHLEKKLAKQRASTSTLPETRKKKVKFTLYTLFWKPVVRSLMKSILGEFTPSFQSFQKLEEGFGSGSPKKASAGHKTTTKTIKAKNSMMKDTRKAKRLMNEQVQRAVNMVEQEIAAIKLNKLKAMKVPKLRTESIPKRQYLMSTQEQEINQSSSTKLGQKELVQSKKVVFNVSFKNREICHLRTVNPRIISIMQNVRSGVGKLELRGYYF
ncbi:unnamed protein product [Brugia pahangi]|uniref:Coiled-coil domain-containing protein 86 n=1 Tax=Brugia pahangi TaxID=6280 RepID=A0A0N4TSE4_BRUPA|nr:unnamed protein product [Brugia pahangi]